MCARVKMLICTQSNTLVLFLGSGGTRATADVVVVDVVTVTDHCGKTTFEPKGSPQRQYYSVP